MSDDVDYGEIVNHHPEGPDQIVSPHERAVAAETASVALRKALERLDGKVHPGWRQAVITQALRSPGEPSPPRDDTVAVEDVVAFYANEDNWRGEQYIAGSSRRQKVWGAGNAPVLIDGGARARQALAEFGGRAATDERG